MMAITRIGGMVGTENGYDNGFPEGAAIHKAPPQTRRHSSVGGDLLRFLGLQTYVNRWLGRAREADCDQSERMARFRGA